MIHETRQQAIDACKHFNDVYKVTGYQGAFDGVTVQVTARYRDPSGEICTYVHTSENEE